MSEIVQSTIIAYFDSQNAAGVYSSANITSPYTIHEDNNTGEPEEGSAGPFIKTFIIEEEWNKIDDQRKVVGGSLTHTSLEEGQFILQIHVWKGLGDRDLRAQTVVAGKIKRDFVKLELPTTTGFIHFGSSLMRPTIDIEAQHHDGDWQRTDLLINYYYIESYT